MLEHVDKLMLAGLGAISLTKQKAEKLFDEMVRQGNQEKNARSGFIREMMETAQSTRNDVQDFIHQQVRHALKGLNLATKDDLARLEARIQRHEHATHAAKPSGRKTLRAGKNAT